MSTDLSNYVCETEKLEGTKINVEQWTEGFKEKEETSLLLITDKNQWEISSEHIDAWKSLQDKKNIGKNIKFYIRNYAPDKFINPNQIEIDGKIIYSIKDDLMWDYILLLIVLLFTLYNIDIVRFNLKYK